MGAESNIRKRIIKLLKPLDGISVENSAKPGTPDINYKYGCMELKQVDRWPPRGGPLRIPHFTPLQRIRHRKRRYVGGISTVLTRVGRDWFLMDGKVAAELLGFQPKQILIDNSIFYWKGSLNGKELLEYLATTHAT